MNLKVLLEDPSSKLEKYVYDYWLSEADYYNDLFSFTKDVSDFLKINHYGEYYIPNGGQQMESEEFFEKYKNDINRIVAKDNSKKIYDVLDSSDLLFLHQENKTRVCWYCFVLITKKIYRILYNNVVGRA